MSAIKGARQPQDRDRAIAMERALFMSKLFREPYYTNIMSSLNLYSSASANEDSETMKVAETKFETTCKNAGLIDKETVWLWNYLKNYNPELADWEVRAQVNVNW